MFVCCLAADNNTRTRLPPSTESGRVFRVLPVSTAPPPRTTFILAAASLGKYFSRQHAWNTAPRWLCWVCATFLSRAVPFVCIYYRLIVK